MADLDSKVSKKGGKERPFLSPQTFECMLHRWPDWGQSVKMARELPEMGYPLPDSYEERQKWIDQHGGWVWQFATKVMNNLNLPEHLWQYWLCCVYSDYEVADGSIDYSKIVDFWGRQRLKVYPPPPYKVVIVGDANKPGKFGPVSTEVHPSFSYRAVREQAMLHAQQVAETFCRDGLHPVLDYRQWAKGQSQRSPHKLAVRKRFLSGQYTLEDILREEAESQQVRAELERIRDKYKVKFERKLQVRNLRRKVLARVRARLSDLKPLPRIRGKWWPYSD